LFADASAHPQRSESATVRSVTAVPCSHMNASTVGQSRTCVASVTRRLVDAVLCAHTSAPTPDSGTVEICTGMNPPTAESARKCLVIAVNLGRHQFPQNDWNEAPSINKAFRPTSSIADMSAPTAERGHSGVESATVRPVASVRCAHMYAPTVAQNGSCVASVTGPLVEAVLCAGTIESTRDSGTVVSCTSMNLPTAESATECVWRSQSIWADISAPRSNGNQSSAALHMASTGGTRASARVAQRSETVLVRRVRQGVSARQ
jgi:hypothetical protein